MEETRVLRHQAGQAAAPAAQPATTGSEATQFIPPSVGGGPLPDSALPPQAQHEAPAESTRFLGHRPLPQGSGSAAEATQLLPPAPPSPPGAPPGPRPGAPGDRQPPAEFDGLFRSEPAPERALTQPIPRFEGEPRQPYEPQGRADHRTAGRRGLSPAALLGIVVAGCAITGLAAGAALSSDGDGKQTAAGRGPALEAPTPDSGRASPSADPAEQQAKALDKLLEDSNDSRTTVVNSVGDIRRCANLAQAAAELRKAAEQRNILVSRLSKLSVDKLPNHLRLTASLTDAWRASAKADNHYAAWADQVAGKKGCRKGRAKVTGQTAAGDRASSHATAAKHEAARLWNALAADHGLTRHRPEQL